MDPRLLPRGVKTAIELMRRNLERAWTISELAAGAGLSTRTLQAQFRRFVGTTPIDFLRMTRLAEARRQLLLAEAGATVTSVATACWSDHR
jgi:transcriptional regulator GlxA family with amidase domain